jgi:hypothetical protein
MEVHMIPKALKNFNLFIDGRGFAGKCAEVTPPKLTLKLDEHRAGGMDAPVELDMGMDKLNMEATLNEFDAEVIALFGLTTSGVKSLTLRGALEGDDGVIPVVVNVRATVKEVDLGAWKPGEKSAKKLQFACRYFKYTQDGRELIEIDVENMVRRIGGVDQLAAQRQALGI